MGGLKAGLPELRDGFRPEVIDLGRYLFFTDPLSESSLACSSCHDQTSGFDGKGVLLYSRSDSRAIGTGLWNIGFQRHWGRAKPRSRSRCLGPLYSELEMGNTPENLLKTLNDGATYRAMFADAFHADNASTNADNIRLDMVYEALMPSKARWSRSIAGLILTHAHNALASELA